MKRYVVLWLLSLVLVGTASAWISAQKPTIVRPEPFLLSGPDIGVQVESTDGKIAFGKIVVQIDGKWLELGPSIHGGVYRIGQ